MYSANRKIDSVPPIAKKGMLGQDGTQTRGSVTLWRGSEGHLDVENIKPGFREGSIHFQPYKSDLKFQYDPCNQAFLPSNGVQPPRYLNNLFSSNRGFIRAIRHGLKILGEIK